VEQILNKIEVEGVGETIIQPEIPLGPFKLPQPPPLTQEEVAAVGKSTVSRLLGMISARDDPALVSKRQQNLGLNRLAGSNYDKGAWTTLISRLATRASIEVGSNGETESPIKTENQIQKGNKFSMANTIRESFFLYILEDFRRRIDIAISWLTEEWFNEQIRPKIKKDQSNLDSDSPYQTYLNRLLSSILPYLDGRTDTKFLVRFLSEIPSLPSSIYSLVGSLAKDPERVMLCVSALHYLVIMRPPAREEALDQLEEIWRNEAEARNPAGKLLAKWRPGVLEAEKGPLKVLNGVEKKEIVVDAKGNEEGGVEKAKPAVAVAN
jgi:symplekin